MADVITWRQMAGPNFSGTAAAMDAAGDRIKQGTDLFTQVAADQSKVFQQQKAKVKADNTARALSQIGAIRDLGELDSAAPNFTFDSLTGSYGPDNIDAGTVAQAAINQRGVIQKNQLNDIQFYEAKLVAEEAPLVGEAKEAMAAAIASGDKAKMAEIEAFYTPKLRDASFLGQARQEFDEQQFNRNLQQSQEDRAVTTTNQQTTLFDQEQERINANKEAFGLVQAVVTGKMNTADVAARIKTVDGLNTFSKALTQTEMFSGLPKDTQMKLDIDINDRNLAVTAKNEEAKSLLENIKQRFPQEDPSVMAFKSSIGGERQKIINQLGTGTAVLANKVRELGIQGADWGLEVSEKEASEVDTYVRNTLKEKGIDLNEVDPMVMEAALSNLQKNSEGKLDESALDVSIDNVKQYMDAQENYKNNTKQYKALEKDIVLKERAINSTAAQINAKELRLAELTNKMEIARQNLGTLEFNGAQKGYNKAVQGKEYNKWDMDSNELISEISNLKDKLDEQKKQLDIQELQKRHGYIKEEPKK
jgi:hypothetical protein